MNQWSHLDRHAEARRRIDQLRERLSMRSLYPDSYARHMGCFVNAEIKVPSFVVDLWSMQYPIRKSKERQLLCCASDA